MISLFGSFPEEHLTSRHDALSCRPERGVAIETRGKKQKEKTGQAITDTELFGQEQNGLAEHFPDPMIL